MSWLTCSRRLIVAALPVLSTAALAAPDVQQPLPDQLIWQGAVIVAHSNDTATEVDQSTFLATVDGLLQQSSRSGDPKFLGEANARLAALQAHQWTTELLIRRAVVEQRLHQFDRASQTLNTVLEREPAQAQALLIAFAVALTRGDQTGATAYCARYGEQRSDLAALTCSALLQARRGDVNQGAARLSDGIAAWRGSRADGVYVWALSMLAEMLSDQQPERALRLWALAHALDADDLYVRQQYADAALRAGDTPRVLTLTDGWEGVEGLALTRILALRQQDADAADLLARSLAARFDQALARGDFLHAHEYARFLLDVAGKSDDAFNWAWKNWQQQKQLPDYRLLQRAALSSDQRAALPSTLPWQEGG